MEETQKRHLNVDLSRLLQLVWADRKRFVLWCFVAAVIGVIVAFSIPKYYRASVVLAPETTGGSSLSSNISSLASMVGMNLSLGNDYDAIYPEIYPDLMGSNNFRVRLFAIRVRSLDGTIDTDYFTYLTKHTKMPWWDYPGVLFKEVLKRVIPRKPEYLGEDSIGGPNPFHLSREQDGVCRAIARLITCAVDKKTDVITITAEAQDPLIAATMADSARVLLQQFITDYRTNKARGDLAYVEQLHEEARQQYAQAMDSYAQYADANQELSLERFLIEKERLSNEVQLSYDVYQQVSEQLQLSKAKVQERTPAFTTLQPAAVPVKHSNMPKVVMLVLFIFLGFVCRLAVLSWKRRKEIFALA